MSSLVGYEPYINNCIAVFSEKMKFHVKKRKSLDLAAWFQLYAFDVIGEITVRTTAHIFVFPIHSPKNGAAKGLQT